MYPNGRPGLGNIFDTLTNFANKVSGTAAKVSAASGQLSTVASGEGALAVVPTNRASVTIPLPGQAVGFSVPLMPLAVGAALLAVFALTRGGRRRRR